MALTFFFCFFRFLLLFLKDFETYTNNIFRDFTIDLCDDDDDDVPNTGIPLKFNQRPTK